MSKEYNLLFVSLVETNFMIDTPYCPAISIMMYLT
jgi:hypothetical protein